MNIPTVVGWLIVLICFWRIVSQGSRLHMALDRRDLVLAKRRSQAVHLASSLTLVLVIVLTTWRMPFSSGHATMMAVVAIVGLLMSSIMAHHAIIRLADST